MAIATLGPYFVVWLMIGLVNYSQMVSARSYLNVAIEPMLIDSYTNRFIAAQTLFRAAILWGVIIPVIVGPVALVGWWVWRGFKPKADDA